MHELTKKLVKFKINVSKWLGKNAINMFELDKNKNSLSERQFLILAHLDVFNQLTISQFEKMFHISKSSISLTISKLELNGYVKKEKGSLEEDGRKVYICLTDTGKAIVDEINLKFENFFNDFFGRLTKPQRKKLILAIDIFNSILNEEEQK
ncbi:MAG: MarR family transcriptional regulator [Lachnospiraceae bacterium]|nr:MarR family transcriptional regulator [Lachnospiraceae bacterium]